MEHIRKSKINKNDNICVYGLDADLIMLTLIQENNNIYLLRENTHINSVDETIKFLYVSIYDLKVNLFSEINSNFINNFDKTYIMQNIVNDYVFLCFLLGNDFLHSLPSLKINTGGIDFILKIYCNILKKLNNQLVLKSNEGIFSINNKFLLNIFKSLSNNEESNLKYLQSKKRIPNVPAIDDAYKELKYKWDRIPLNDLFKKYYNVIDYRAKNCRNKYYKIMFKLNINEDIDEINNICKNYFDGLFFTTNYYFNQITYWEWYNPYLESPFVSDLYNYLKSNIKDINKLDINCGEVLTPIEQLMYVLPRKSLQFLPKIIQNEITDSESDIYVYYPSEFTFHMEEKFMLYSIEPILPNIDINKIRRTFKKIKGKLSNEILLKNNLGELFKYNKN